MPKGKSTLSIQERWWVLRKQDICDQISHLDSIHSVTDRIELFRLLDIAYDMGKKSTRKYYKRILKQHGIC